MINPEHKILLIILSYLFGSISTSTIICRIKNVDIKKIGSGNAGATNTVRALGKKYGALVLILDILKGIIPTLIASTLSPSTLTLPVLCAFSTVLGHVLAMITLALATSTLHVVAYTIIQGLSWGARTPILTSMRGDYFGRAAFASIMGTSQSIAMIGMILGPLIVGYCADHYSYQTGFYVISALTAPGFLLLLSLEDSPL